MSLYLLWRWQALNQKLCFEMPQCGPDAEQDQLLFTHSGLVTLTELQGVTTKAHSFLQDLVALYGWT